MSDTIRQRHKTEQTTCMHTRQGIVRFLCADDSIQLRAGGLDCGRAPLPSLSRREHPGWETYSLVVPHPYPCLCHPDKASGHTQWQASPLGYEAYLQSEQWRERRSYFIARALNRCQACNEPGGPGGSGLHLHHRTYARLGCELDVDVQVLCKHHHDLFHADEKAQRSAAA